MSYLIVAVLVILSGIFSGLTLGFFSINLTALDRKRKLRDKRAEKIYPIRKRGNLLLCTLLLGNVAVNSTMAIFLGNISSGLMAGFISTSLIVVFGEILPQAVFSRYALTVGAYSVWPVRVFIFILYPIAFPLSWMLDKLLGEELPTIWNKREIKEIIKVHEDHESSEIDEDEERILIGALSFSEKKVENVMTPRVVVYSLNAATPVTQELLEEIKKKGFTRIPIYSDTMENITGLLFAKNLIGVIGDGLKTIDDYVVKERILTVRDTMMLDNLLNHFIRSKRHMALVYDAYSSFTGIVTLEDVIEEIIKLEIVDEADSSDDMQKLAFKMRKTNIIDK